MHRRSLSFFGALVIVGTFMSSIVSADGGKQSCFVYSDSLYTKTLRSKKNRGELKELILKRQIPSYELRFDFGAGDTLEVYKRLTSGEDTLVSFLKENDFTHVYHSLLDRIRTDVFDSDAYTLWSILGNCPIPATGTSVPSRDVLFGFVGTTLDLDLIPLLLLKYRKTD